MESSSGKPAKIGYIPSLNGLRALSVAVVFWAHAGMPGGVRGGAGVTVFFFLSGFLITTLLRAEYDRLERISLKDFYVRRVLRIVPPMLIAVAVGVAFVLLGMLASDLSVGGIASNVLFFTNYWIIAGLEGFPDGLGVLWSLAVEEHYYLVFPLLHLALRRLLPRRLYQVVALGVICLAVLLWRCWLVWGDGVDIVRVYYATDTRIDGILLGAMLAIGCNPVYGEVPEWMRKHLPIMTIVAGVAFSPFVLPRFTEDVSVYSWGVTFQAVCLIPIFMYVILAPDSWLGKVLNSRPLNFIGILSYSIYLLHSIFLHVFEECDSLPRVVEIGLAVILSVGGAYVVHVAVERPITRTRRKLSHAG